MRYPSLPFAALLRPFFVCFLFLLLASPAWAQSQARPNPKRITLSPDDLERGLNGQQNKFYFARGNSKDFKSAGFWGQHLRPYLTDNQQALDFLNSYRRQKLLMTVERVTFVGAVALYGQQILASDEQQYFNRTQQVAIGVAVASLISNILITRHTNQHMQRAVDEYNSSLPKLHSSVLRRLSPAAYGVVAPTGRPQLALRWQLR